MNFKTFSAVVLVLVLGLPFAGRWHAQAGTAPPSTSTSEYKVLAPIRHGSLTVFPIVAAKSFDTSEFLTLDEGLRSGDVVVTESGSIRSMMRRHSRPIPVENAQVNQLVLVNNSKRPLLLLAGEIVTGGKQDRVIGKDRIVPAESDPIDLSVFCVEPGRWVGTSDKFGIAPGVPGGVSGALMAAPSGRSNAVGVVVAMNGQIIWADIFASTNLLEKYWPKLIRSYAAEAVVTKAKGAEVGTKAAQEFLAEMDGRRETVESEPGIYRHTEITGDDFKAFELTSLLPKTGFNVHIAKMAE